MASVRFSWREIIMSMQYRLPDQVVRADPWTLFCAECSQKMRIMMATPAQHGRETRTYECACGHSERINVAIHSPEAASVAASQVSRTSTISPFPKGAWSTASRYAL
jgi:hypothetical protein